MTRDNEPAATTMTAELQRHKQKNESSVSVPSAVANVDNNNNNDNDNDDAPTEEERYDDYNHIRKQQHWKDSSFAVGLVDVTWADSRNRRNRRRKQNNNDDESDDYEYQSCLHHSTMSAWVCPLLRAGRVGNMVILKQTIVVNDENDDNNNNPPIVPRLDCVMGPYWTVTVCLTCPIIVILSSLAAWRVTSLHVVVIIIWVVLTVALLLSLGLTSCRDPGIMKRYSQIPTTTTNDGNEVSTTTREEEEWRWNDQAQTYRPKSAKYDPECAVVIEGYDHTCPWTGTAIGRRNLMAFRFFVGLIFTCLVFDIFIIISPFVLG